MIASCSLGGVGGGEAIALGVVEQPRQQAFARRPWPPPWGQQVRCEPGLHLIPKLLIDDGGMLTRVIGALMVDLSWVTASGIVDGVLLRSINKAGQVWGCGFSPKVIWGVVKEKAKICEIPALAPHDLRRTCARLCHQAGGELEQIQFLLGHVSVQATERYLGCKQRFHNAVNDRIGLEPDPAGSS